MASILSLLHFSISRYVCVSNQSEEWNNKRLRGGFFFPGWICFSVKQTHSGVPTSFAHGAEYGFLSHPAPGPCAEISSLPVFHRNAPTLL